MVEKRSQWTSAEEVGWRAEFEKLGRETVRTYSRGFPVWKRTVATYWLREKEIEAEMREREAHWYLKCTFVAAVVAALAAVVGVAVAVLHL